MLIFLGTSVLASIRPSVRLSVRETELMASNLNLPFPYLLHTLVTLVVSEAQSDLCRKSGLDPESPVCARVMLTGHIEKVIVLGEEGEQQEE